MGAVRCASKLFQSMDEVERNLIILDPLFTFRPRLTDTFLANAFAVGGLAVATVQHFLLYASQYGARMPRMYVLIIIVFQKPKP